MRWLLFAAIIFGGFLSAPARAQSSTVGDWTVEKRSQDQHCNISRSYKDKEDENRDYAIVLTYSDKAIVMHERCP